MLLVRDTSERRILSESGRMKTDVLKKIGRLGVVVLILNKIDFRQLASLETKARFSVLSDSVQQEDMWTRNLYTQQLKTRSKQSRQRPDSVFVSLNVYVRNLISRASVEKWDLPEIRSWELGLAERINPIIVGVVLNQRMSSIPSSFIPFSLTGFCLLLFGLVTFAPSSMGWCNKISQEAAPWSSLSASRRVHKFLLGIEEPVSGILS